MSGRKNDIIFVFNKCAYVIICQIKTVKVGYPFYGVPDAGGECNIRFPFQKPFNDLSCLAFLYFHLYVSFRIFFHKQSDWRGKTDLPHMVYAADPDSAAAGTELQKSVTDGLVFNHGIFSVDKKSFAGWSQVKLAPASVKKLNLEFVFQLADVLGERRLGDCELVGSFGKASIFGYG